MMDVDINTLRGISTILVMVAFLGVCLWAYSSKRKDQFDEAAHLPFDDETTTPDQNNDDQLKTQRRQQA